MTCYYFSPVQLLETLWTVAQQASLSMGFSRQGYWNGLPCPLPGDLPDPGIGPVPSASPALQADFSTPEPHWKPFWWLFTGFIFSNVSILTFQCLYFVDISPVNSIVLMVIFFFHFKLMIFFFSSVQFSSVAQPCPNLCDPMNHSAPGLPVHHQFPEFTHTHAHRVGDPIQPFHPLSSPSPPAPNAS